MLREDLAHNLNAMGSLNQHYHYVWPGRAADRLLEETQHLDSRGQDPSTRSVVEPTGVRGALEYLEGQIQELARIFPAEGRLAATSHAHLDVAWLWPLSETRRKIRHTFANVLTLMEHFPDFHFTASSAQLYAYVQQDDPELFELVRQKVAEGRIEPVGGMWLEPDGNLPSGEAFVRHLLYGQRYFDREFGRRSTVAWVPDTFGLAANLPQILAGAGMRSFFTQKLSWNDTNDFPFDLWRWEGIDGTSVTAHSFINPIGGYNGQINPEAFERTWLNFRGKDLHPESLFTFGMGDGGRGPTSDMLERLRVLAGYPVLPAVRQTTVEEFFSEIDPNGLPTWLGELYLEFHRGTYTTQARIKRLNRMSEQRMQEAETLATLAYLSGSEYPRADIDGLWTTLLRNQFHDILPGSSIREVNEQAEQELGSVVDGAIAIRDRASSRLVDAPANSQSRSVVVFNPHATPRPLSCELSGLSGDRFRLMSNDGREIAWQPTIDGDVLAHDPEVGVPGLGWVALSIDSGEPVGPEHAVTVQDRVLENDLLRVEILDDGSIQSVFDKRADREVLSGPGNQLRVYHDLPAAWEAWNLTDTSRLPGEPISDIEAIEVVEDGPLRGAIEIRRRYGSSRITQRYVLRSGSARLDIRTVIDWQERRRLLRALFPLNVRSARATFETSYGAVERPTHRNTSWDAAKFEVPGHRWADLSEPGFGASLLNDGRYGYSALGSTLGLSLLRSPLEPDPQADIGRHEFTYSLYSHPGEWHQSDLIREAMDLNSPLIGHVVGTPPEANRSWLDVDGLTLGAFKRAEDSADVVLRLYDPFGRHGVARVQPHLAVEQVVPDQSSRGTGREPPVSWGWFCDIPVPTLRDRQSALETSAGSPNLTLLCGRSTDGYAAVMWR